MRVYKRERKCVCVCQGLVKVEGIHRQSPGAPPGPCGTTTLHWVQGVVTVCFFVLATVCSAERFVMLFILDTVTEVGSLEARADPEGNGDTRVVRTGVLRWCQQAVQGGGGGGGGGGEVYSS